MTFAIFSCALWLVMWSAPAQSRLQLPQVDSEALLPAAESRVLADELGRGKIADALARSAAAEQALVRALPSDFRDACRVIVNQWGTMAEGTARWSVRLLHRTTTADRSQFVLAFRCGSNLLDYAKYFDERPAVLTVESAKARLRLIPVDKPCADCSDLYRIEISQVFAVEGGALLELKATSTNDNPALGVIDTHRAERLLYILLPEARSALMIVRAAEFVSHDDVEGDTETTCRIGMSYQRDAASRLTAIIADGLCDADDAGRRPGTHRYRWNAATRRLEPAAAKAPAAKSRSPSFRK